MNPAIFSLLERQSDVCDRERTEQICNPRGDRKTRQSARNAREAKRNAQRGGGWTRKADAGRTRASAIRQRARWRTWFFPSSLPRTAARRLGFARFATISRDSPDSIDPIFPRPRGDRARRRSARNGNARESSGTLWSCLQSSSRMWSRSRRVFKSQSAVSRGSFLRVFLKERKREREESAPRLCAIRRIRFGDFQSGRASRNSAEVRRTRSLSVDGKIT